MVTLRKLKHLATQCAATWSGATRSPSTPVLHLQRSRSCNTSSRVTLGMLMDRNLDQSGRDLPQHEASPPIHRRDQRSLDRDTEKRRSLKELFATTTAMLREKESVEASPIAKAKRKEEAAIFGGDGMESGRRLRRSLSKPAWTGFRYRLSKRAWRPELVVIAE